MNQFRTSLFKVILSALMAPSLTFANFSRTLKPNEIETLRANVTADPRNVNSRLFLGNHFYGLSNWQEVIRYLHPVLENLPVDSLYQLSSSYLMSGDLREAESTVNILLSQKKNHTNNLLLSVEISSLVITETSSPFVINKAREKLFDTLKEAASLDPANPKIYGVWLEKLDKHLPESPQESLRVLEDMKKNGIPFSPKHYSLMCKYNFLAKFSKETKTSCKTAIARDKGNPANFVYLGQTHVDLGEVEAGKRMLASVGRDFAHSEEALWATANSYYENKDLSSAFSFFKKATEHSQAQPRDFLGLAKVSFELKRYDVSLHSFVEHCRRTNFLDQEFRKASGLLIDQPKWHDLFRQKMQDCNSREKK